MAVRKLDPNRNVVPRPSAPRSVVLGPDAGTEWRETAERAAMEACEGLTREHTIPARADGSRWVYTPPRTFVPRGARGPQTADEMRAALEAIKPHRNPKPKRAESPDAYCARMTKLHRDRFAVGGSEGWHGGVAPDPDAWERLPDSPDEIERDPLAEDAAAQDERRILEEIDTAAERERDAVAEELQVRGWDPAGADALVTEGMGPTEIAARAVISPGEVGALDVTHGLAPVIPIRRNRAPLRGAGAWSLNRERTRIPVITDADASEVG